MPRVAIAACLLLALAALALAAHAVRQQRLAVERLDDLQRLAHQQQVDQRAMEGNLSDHARWFSLLPRAQESPWVGEEGSPVQARLAAHADELPAGEPVRLLAELRNAGDREQKVTGLFFHEFAVNVTRDGTPLKYTGPQKSMPGPGTVVLPSGRIIRAALDLTPAHYALDQPGTYRVTWTYTSRADSGPVTWTGQLPAAEASWKVR
ncbi:MAG TPA: hypothetical protein VFB66_01305 [Tepidisphaeraceae bacterium]|nr:hypothetical protein [Tepidisphaeraceae bacterium]